MSFQNDESAKMLQSRMIRYRRSLAYNNSNTAHINEVLLNGDLVEHKGLLFAIGYTRYTSYFEKIISFFILDIAFAGFRPLGQVFVQFIIV